MHARRRHSTPDGHSEKTSSIGACGFPIPPWWPKMRPPRIWPALQTLRSSSRLIATSPSEHVRRIGSFFIRTGKHTQMRQSPTSEQCLSWIKLVTDGSLLFVFALAYHTVLQVRIIVHDPNRTMFLKVGVQAQYEQLSPCSKAAKQRDFESTLGDANRNSPGFQPGRS